MTQALPKMASTNSPQVAMLLSVDTNGLPSRRHDGSKDYSTARVVRVAIDVRDLATGLGMISFTKIVTPVGFVVSNSQFHGISHGMARSTGIAFSMVAQEIQPLLETPNCVLVGHNLEFHKEALIHELVRHKLVDMARTLNRMPSVCTMQAAQQYFDPPRLASLVDTHAQLCSEHDPRVQAVRELNVQEAGTKLWMLRQCLDAKPQMLNIEAQQ